MKTLLGLFISFMAFNVYAGNGGGTMGMAAQAKEIVFNQGEDGENVKFQYAVQENGGWSVQEVRVPKMQIDPRAMEALRESRDKNKWSLIKGN